MTDDTIVQFIAGVEQENVSKEIWRSINKLYSQLAHLVNYKYHLLLYRLVKKDYVDIKNLEQATGFTKQRIYQIVNQFEEREMNRQAESEA